MSKHTPGPWTFDEHGGCFYVWGRNMAMVADGDSDEGYIARMRGVGRGATPEEQEANARLIAAAPDLLQALRDLRDASVEAYKAGRIEAFAFVTANNLIAEIDGE